MWVEGFFFCSQCTKFNGKYMCSLGWEQMPFMNRLSGGISWFMFSSQLSPGFFHSVPLLAINCNYWKSENEGKFMNYTQSQCISPPCSSSWETLEEKLWAISKFSNVFSMSLSHSVFDMLHKLFIWTTIILLACVVLWHHICRMIFILRLQWINLKEISSFFLYSALILQNYVRRTQMWTEFFLTLKHHYCFHPAISQEDVNKAYLRNISIFFSLSLSWKKE